MKKIIILFILLPLLCFAQEKSLLSRRFHTAFDVIKNLVKSTPSDFTYMGKSITQDWKKTALYTGIVASLVLLDKPITTFYQSEIETRIQYSLPKITLGIFKNSSVVWLGGNNAYMTYTTGAIYFGSLITGYEKGQYVAVNAFKSVVYSTLITQLILKTAFGRTRPYPNLKNPNLNTKLDFTDDPFDFFNSRGGVYVQSSERGSAMPSLHATAFFAMAKVFQMEFDNYWIPYGFMAAVFMADIKSHRHWVSDMVAGGIIGTIIGRSVVRSSWKARGLLANKEKAFNIELNPVLSARFTGVNLSVKF